MIRKLAIAIALLLLPSAALAACTNPLGIKDGSAAAISMSVSTNADGFCQYNFNMAQINGVVPLMGNGATGTGSPRVTIANDNSPVATKIDQTTDGTTNAVRLLAETTKVIGVAKVGDGTSIAAVKAASTAPGATDPALVVTISPNGAQATATKQSDGSQKTQVVDGSGNVQPSGDAVGRAIFEKITDGTNTAAVKAASTAPAATDPAVVVALSPNGAQATAANQTSQITQETAVNTALGAQGDTACSTDNGTCTAIALIKRGNQNQTTQTAAINAAVPAGTNTIGAVGHDPSLGKATPTQAFLALPATTTTQIIALNGSKLTYVTFAKVFAGGTVNVTLKYGTGSNCGTGTTTLEGPYPLTAQAGWTEGSGTGPVIIVPSGQALCVTTDASVTGGVKLIYQQI